MRFGARSLLIFLLLLVPSGQFAWRNRDLPEFAYLHDDGLLFVTGQSLATGNGYRIPSLPENPPQTKFPPLYPLYLSLIWRLNPHFPDNLRVATVFSWALLAICLLLAWRMYRCEGFSEKRTRLLVALLAINPYLILFGCSMFTEVFFTCCVVATFLAARQRAMGMVVVAGLAAGLAYLSRTAGIALLVSVPAWMLLKRDWKGAGVFVMSMLPALIGWSLWAQAHLPRSTDQTLLYYTDYLGYRALNIGFDNLAVLLWKNTDQILYGMGSLLLPKVLDTLAVKMLAWVIAVAMIVGVVRLARRGIAVHYALFALVSVGIMLVWHFPPNERFVLPLYPLLIAGLLAELEHLGEMLKKAFHHKDFSQRVVAGLMSAAVVVVLGAAVVLQLYVSFVFLQETANQKRAKLADLRAAYTWISANVPASAAVLSYDDPLLYLYSGRRGNYMPLLSRWWYSEDHANIVNAYRNLPAYCRSRGLEYVYFTSDDLGREVGDEDRQAIQRVVRESAELTPVFTAGIGTVYKLNRARQ